MQDLSFLRSNDAGMRVENLLEERRPRARMAAQDGQRARWLQHIL